MTVAPDLTFTDVSWDTHRLNDKSLTRRIYKSLIAYEADGKSIKSNIQRFLMPQNVSLMTRMPNTSMSLLNSTSTPNIHRFLTALCVIDLMTQFPYWMSQLKRISKNSSPK